MARHRMPWLLPGAAIAGAAVFAAVASAAARAPAAGGGAAAAPARAILGGTLLDGTGAPPVPDAAVVVREGRIECAGARRACPVPAGAEIVDASHRWVTPGLVDAHVHFSQTGWADGRPDALDLRDRHPYDQAEAELRRHPEAFFRSYLCSGVTAVFDVGGYPWTLELPARAEGDPGAPHVAAAGPLLSTWDFWLNLPAERQFIYLANEKAAREGVRYLAAQGAAAVKIWFIVAKERRFETMAALVRAAGDEARRAGLPLIVHATGLREAKEALRAGARLLVHGVGDLPVDDDFLRLARGNGTTYCPTLTVPDGYRRLWEAAVTGKAPAVDDPNGCVDAATLAKVRETAAVGAERVDRKRYDARAAGRAERRNIEFKHLKRVAAAGIPVAMGTDAGNPLTLHGPSVHAEMEAMQAAGLAPMQVLVASTRNAAAAMGRLADLGTIEKGKIADLLVVGGDPSADIANLRRVETVVRAGVVRSVADLRAQR